MIIITHNINALRIYMLFVLHTNETRITYICACARVYVYIFFVLFNYINLVTFDHYCLLTFTYLYLKYIIICYAYEHIY